DAHGATDDPAHGRRVSLEQLREPVGFAGEDRRHQPPVVVLHASFDSALPDGGRRAKLKGTARNAARPVHFFAGGGSTRIHHARSPSSSPSESLRTMGYFSVRGRALSLTRQITR